MTDSISTVVASKPGELPRPIPEVGAAVDAYSEIQAALPGRPRWQLVAFTAGCAQRLLPMAAHLGGPSIAEPAQAGVALAWNAAAGRTLQPELEQAISDLRQAMEAAPEDRLGRKLLAAWAMDLTVFALEAAATSTLPPWGAAQAAAAGAIDLLGQVDLALGHLPLQHRVIIEPDDGEEEPHGPLQTKEIQAQQTSIALLDMGDRPDTQAIEAVRRLSQAQAAELVEVMPEFARRWTEEVMRRWAEDAPEN
jgi:hypothetical protein